MDDIQSAQIQSFRLNPKSEIETGNLPQSIGHE
jgi:hypothetical protein